MQRWKADTQFWLRILFENDEHILENRPKKLEKSCDDFRIDFKFAGGFFFKGSRAARSPWERHAKTDKITCVPLFENDQKRFWYDELFYPKSHTLAGSVSELSQILGLYIHTYIQGFLKESLTKLVSIGSRLYQRILQFCKYCATRDDLLHIMVSKPFRSAQK